MYCASYLAEFATIATTSPQKDRARLLQLFVLCDQGSVLQLDQNCWSNLCLIKTEYGSVSGLLSLRRIFTYPGCRTSCPSCSAVGSTASYQPLNNASGKSCKSHREKSIRTYHDELPFGPGPVVLCFTRMSGTQLFVVEKILGLFPLFNPLIRHTTCNEH